MASPKTPETPGIDLLLCLVAAWILATLVISAANWFGDASVNDEPDTQPGSALAAPLRK